MAEAHKLDCSGLVCPLPVARTKRKLLEMESGEILEVFGDFAEAGENIRRFVNTHGDEILDFKIEGEMYYLKIKKV